MKEFFRIETKYQFCIFDLTTVFTILNVVLIIMGFKFAPIFGIINCFIIEILNCREHGMINAHVTQIALLVLNFYFLFA